jgi:hypothetical protein
MFTDCASQKRFFLEKTKNRCKNVPLDRLGMLPFTWIAAITRINAFGIQKVPGDLKKCNSVLFFLTSCLEN